MPQHPEYNGRQTDAMAAARKMLPAPNVLQLLHLLGSSHDIDCFDALVLGELDDLQHNAQQRLKHA